MFYPLLLLIVQLTAVLGNTEKAIFIAPGALQVPVAHPTLEDLHLDTLSPQHPSVRTHIQAAFPTDNSEYGLETWVLLARLKEGQRYEVRVCWAATQPTSFRLETYKLSTVFEQSELMKSLARYSETRQPDPIRVEDQKSTHFMDTKKESQMQQEPTSILFLQILAAADYYTANTYLMENVPPVYVDIILDPYLFNVFPRSLVPTAGYVTILAIGSWLLSRIIYTWVHSFLNHDINLQKKRA